MNAVVQMRQPIPVMPATIDDIERMAHAVAKSGLFGAKSPEQAMALMLVAQAEGLHPASAARDYDIIQGRPAKKSEAMLRDFIKVGGSVKWHQLDDTIADATFTHEQGGEVRLSWDIPRATKTGLSGKDMWKKWPRQMLRARCLSEGIRTVCPLATGGMYVPEEIRDMEPETNAPLTKREVIAAAIAAPEMDEAERGPLLAQMHEAAMSGTESLQAAWKAITKEQRQALKDELPRFKAAAAKAEAEFIEAGTDGGTP